MTFVAKYANVFKKFFYTPMRDIFVALVATIFSITILHAQDSLATKKEWQMTAGAMFAPQGGLNLNAAEEGSFTSLQFFLVAPIFYDKWTFTPFYNVSNSTGLAIERTCTPHFGMYAVGTKNTLKPGGYVGFGVDTPVAKGFAALFAEIGTTYGIDEPSPYVFSGVFIPLTLKSLGIHFRPKAR